MKAPMDWLWGRRRAKGVGTGRPISDADGNLSSTLPGMVFKHCLNVLFTLMVICLLPMQAEAANFTAAPGSPFSTGGMVPESVTSADFDGDGKPDLAVGGNFGGTTNDVGILLNNGVGLSPVFGLVGLHTTTGRAASVASADFDSDGNADIATVNPSKDNASVLLGNGLGGILGPASTFTTGTGPNSVTIADFNEDNRPDLAVANQNGGSGNTVSILLNTSAVAGTAVFAAKTDFPVAPGVNPFSVTSADFDGDGHADLATANANSGKVTVLLGDGAGSFSTAQPFETAGALRSVTSADFNGDSKPDIAVVSETWPWRTRIPTMSASC